MSAEIYQKRLHKLITCMEPDSCLILFSPEPSLRNQDVYYPYRSSSDILYLTGIHQQNIIFVLFSDGEKYIFSEKYNPKKERWEGKQLTGEQIAERLGFSEKETHYMYEEFWEKIPQLIKKKRLLYWNFKNQEKLNQKILHLLNELRRDARGGNFFLDHLVHSASIIDEMRIFKDNFEISLMKKAAAISSFGHKKLMQYTRSRVKNTEAIFEYQLRAQLEANFMKEGAEALAYPSIVASGENATFLHYITCRDQVNKNDLLLVDAGCEVQGYASDITRTYPISGQFSEVQKDIYSLVFEAQKQAIQLCKPNSNLGKVHAKAVHILVQGLWDMGFFKKCIKSEKQGKFIFTRADSVDEVIEKKYYCPFYMHHTSHYLGLDVHDVGLYYKKTKHRKLKPGMTFTVEPGLYFPAIYEHIPSAYRGIGVRIEDNILITQQGHEVLTHEAPKEIKEIEALSAANA